MQTIMLNIEGMHCGACVRRVRAALAGVAGASVGEVAIGRAELEVEEGAAAEASASAVAAIREAGFTPTPA